VWLALDYDLLGAPEYVVERERTTFKRRASLV
jgi:hypothetical protein